MYYRGNGFPKRKSGHLLGVIGIYIVLLACVFAAWGQKGDNAHDGNNIVHAHYYFDFEVTVAPDDEHKRLYSWHEHKVIRDEHGHVTYDKQSHHGDGKRNEGSQNGDGHDGPVDKPETPPSLPPPPPPPSLPPPPPPAPPKKPISTVQTSEPVTPPSQSRTPTTTRVYTERHFYDFSEGASKFIGLPVLPVDVETVKDLWEVFRAEFENDIYFKLMVDGVWQTAYRGEDNGLGKIIVTPHLGINIGVGSWITLQGVPVAGEQIELEPGVHFVGLPEIPSLYKRPSDLLNNNVAWVHVRKANKYPYIYGEGDEGDDLFYAGQAFVIRIMEALTLDLRGEVASAPMTQRQGTLAASWGAMKRR